MASGNVEEVGVRLLVEGGAAFADEFTKASESLQPPRYRSAEAARQPTRARASAMPA